MNSRVGLRLAALGLAVGLMGALIVLVTLGAQKRAEEVGARLGRVDTESFQIADHFKDTLRYANGRMRRFASANDTGAWAEFIQACDELKAWVERQTPEGRDEPRADDRSGHALDLRPFSGEGPGVALPPGGDA